MPFHPLTTRSNWQSPLGLILLSASPLGLSGVFFEDQRHLPDVQAWPEDPNNPFMRAAIVLLKDYFNGQAHALDAPLSLPLDLQCGTHRLCRRFVAQRSFTENGAGLARGFSDTRRRAQHLASF